MLVKASSTNPRHGGCPAAIVTAPADSGAEAEHLIAVLGLGGHRVDETTSQRRSSDDFSLLTPFEKRCAPILDAVAEL